MFSARNQGMGITANPKWIARVGLLLVAAIAVATLMPTGWELRTGLHYLFEHFLVYFAVTLLFCIAWPRPALVAGLLMVLAGLFEALQGLTIDRTPDLLTAMSGAAGVISAALFVQFIIWSRKPRVSA
jgi:hypothetical protein